MSFFKLYEMAIQQKHLDTGMNHGDFYVTVEDVLKQNTQVVNDVDSEINVVKPEPVHPTEDGVMTQTTVDLEHKFECVNRRTARPSHREGKKKTDSDLRDNNNASQERPRDLGRGGNTTKDRSKSTEKPTRKERKNQNRTLKKFGGGYRVRIKIEKVVVNDGTSISSG